MKEKKKSLIICPRFDPMSDGLGHHTTQYFKQLSLKDQTYLLTSNDNAIKNKYENNSQILATVKKWNIICLFRQLKGIDSVNPDYIFVQYEPFMYKKRGGINFSIVFFLLYLRLFKSKNIHIFFHELYHPFNGTLKTLIMFICHHIMLLIALLSSSKVYCSTLNNYKTILPFLFNNQKNLYLLPVGANIDFVHCMDLQNLKMKLGINHDEFVIGLFGTFHLSKNTKQVLKLLTKSTKNFKILYIGANQDEVLNLVDPEIKDDLSKKLIVTGFAEDRDCSSYFQILDTLVCFFIDGLSTRRGSAMMSLSHGVPIISTQTHNTEELFKNKDYIKLLDVDDFDKEFAKLLSTEDFSKLKSIHRKEIMNFYQEHFSWETIIKKYLQTRVS